MRNPGIDRLRGLAILRVVVHHIALRIPLKEWDVLINQAQMA